ncbi:hypothetical protein LINPERPRIM_LOCUS6171 [Linum perenne]
MIEDQLINPRCPKIPFTEAEIKSFYKPWSKALVVKVLERSFSFLAMKRRLEYLWAKSGSIQVSDLSNNFFLVRFANQDDYSLAAFKGPWKIYVSRIGNYIGRTIRLDLATAEGTRGRYARVCVEVDLTKPLLGKYMIEDRVFKVEYESLENVCFDCGFYGHKKESCSSSPAQQDKENGSTSSPTAAPELEAKDPDIGEWMTVQRRHRKKQAQPTAPAAHAKKGSNFSVLQVEEPEDPQILKPDQEELLKRQTEKLRKVLEEALIDPARGQTTARQAPPPASRPALSNITNVVVGDGTGQTRQKVNQKAPQVSDPSSSTSELVAVPIMYQNIAFQADPTELKSMKSKPNVQRKNSATKSKKPVDTPNPLAVKRRTIKKKAPTPEQAETPEPIVTDNGTDAIKTRKPPDRS